MNTPGSLDSLVVKLPESLDFLAYLLPASERIYKKDSTVYSLQSWLFWVFLQSNFGRLHGVFITSKFRLSGDDYTGESQPHDGKSTRESRLPSSEDTGESIVNTK